MAKIQKKYQQSHQNYLKRLQAKPQVHFDNTLPVIEKKEEIKNAILKNQIVIICGETGSGKTTQIPKICLDLGRGISGLIGHTQPRRIAARAVANRIAEELGVKIGNEVGYQVRFQDKISDTTYIKIMTDGILLSEIQTDRYLHHYDTIIVDEAHERSLNIDFLLGYLKQISKKRRDLKIIITSATIDAETFGQYFDEAPIINVSGRMYPVQLLYRPLKFNDEDEIDLSIPETILEVIKELWKNQKGDILVFLPGEREIREVGEFLRKNHLHAEILLLFSRLSSDEQQKIFKPNQFGHRIILATNIAETSLTVPGIKYVIDSGLAKIKRFVTRSKVEQLNIEKISKASAKQRIGRCGRVSAGICVRLYSEADYLERPEFTEPEILRSNLAHVILMMLNLKLGDIYSFPFIDSPDSKLMNNGIQTLYELGAIDKNQQLTTLGKKIVKIPLDPKLARILLAAEKYDCVYEILVIVSVLSIQDPRETSFEVRELAQKIHAKFSDSYSDFMSYLNLWEFFKEHRLSGLSNRSLLKLCHENFLSYLKMKEWVELFKQLKSIVEEMKFRIVENKMISLTLFDKKSAIITRSVYYEHIHRALLTGLVTNVGMKFFERNDYLGVRGTHFNLFPTSVIFKTKPKWIMAAELMETSKIYALNNAVIESEWIEKEALHLVKYHYLDPRWSEKRGEVIANEKVTLYGLTIIQKRIVSYGKIDTETAREIFIKSGLIENNLKLDVPFYINNRKVIKKIKEIENKERKQDFLLDEILFQFYDERLPKDIVGLRSLLKWLSEEEEKNNHLLSIELDKLISKNKQQENEEQFPKYLEFENTQLNLLYRFELNHIMDGVTIKIPLALLNKINAHQLEWLVPGMIRDKLHFLIKALPKNIRRICVPISEFITEFLMSDPNTDESILPQLAHAIVKKSGNMKIMEDIDFSKWSSHPLPNHCYMNIQIIDDDGRELGMGRNLLALRKEFGEDAKKIFGNSNHDYEKENITHWNIGTIPNQAKFSRGKQQLLGYLRLYLDSENHVGLRLFDTEESAQKSHRQGLIALMKMQLKDSMKDLTKGLPDFLYMALCLKDIYPTVDEFKQDILAGVCQEAFLAEDDLPMDEKHFNQQLAKAKHRLPNIKSAMNEYLLKLSTEYSLLKQKLGLHVLTSVIENQLSQLIYPGFVANTPWRIWERFPIYLKAMQLRLDKYTNHPKRDASYEQEIQELKKISNDFILEMEQKRIQIPNILVDFKWKIEELRVSLFAQELKTPFPVSVKRLKKEWEELTKGI